MQFRHNVNFIEAMALFEKAKPYSGAPPVGYFVDFLGTLIHSDFRIPNGADPNHAKGGFVATRRPTISDGEFFFEAANWFLSANEARNNFTMMSLGACYGGQIVGSVLALNTINPLPYKLIAVEPEPTNVKWIRRHFLDNGINPEDHWILSSVLGENNMPIFFPVGNPAIGAQNAISTNEFEARKNYVKEFLAAGDLEKVLTNLLLENKTGLSKSIVPGADFVSEIQLLSSITLDEVLGPFQRIDYLESDIQQSEIIVFPPARATLKRKVRRIHLGTHGKDVHQILKDMFLADGWEVIFDFEPNSNFETDLGTFSTNDGVLTVLNPMLKFG